MPPQHKCLSVGCNLTFEEHDNDKLKHLHMNVISYNIGCRNCLTSDGIRHSYIIKGQDAEDLSHKTEFGVMLLIEKYRNEDNHLCERCGSSNVEVSDLEIDGTAVYDYDALGRRCDERGEEMLQFNISKQGSQINLRVGGSQYIDQDLTRLAILQIPKLLSFRPADNFNNHQNGHFFVCFTGGISMKNFKPFIRVERFRVAGITKDEILGVFKPSADRIGVTLT
jgi:hypothetical protein